MNNFKVGDKVVFINDKPIKTSEGLLYLGVNYEIGKTYTVIKVNLKSNQSIKVGSSLGFISSERFILLSEYRKNKINNIFNE